MILNLAYTVALLFASTSAPSSSAYDHAANVSFDYQCASLVLDGSSHDYYIDSVLHYDAYLKYTTDNTYLLGNHSFEFEYTIYYLDVHNDLVYVNNHSTRSFFDWEIGASSYLGQFDELAFNIYLDVAESDLICNIEYLGIIESSTYYNFSDTFTYSSQLSLTIDFNLNQISDYIRYLDSANEAYSDGYDRGKSEGYADGYVDGQANTMNPEMFTIFNGILNVAMVPVNVFLGIFNFEVFGINIASLVSSIISVMILVIVIRLILGHSSKGD